MKIYKGTILYVKQSSDQVKFRPKLVIRSMPKTSFNYFICESINKADYGPYTEDFLKKNYRLGIKHILEKL